jgi:3-phenylpropionate/cinnamic acid dioxygenase small subunit
MKLESIDAETERDVVHFYYREAAVQDNKEDRKWLAMLTDDATYTLPVRVTKEREAGSSLLKEGGFMVDTKSSLEIRVKRNETEYAWAENPPSRTKHLVSNITIENGEKADEYKVKSYVLLTVNRSDDRSCEVFPYERQDVLKKIDGAWKIASRLIIPEETRLGISAITFFL